MCEFVRKYYDGETRTHEHENMTATTVIYPKYVSSNDAKPMLLNIRKCFSIWYLRISNLKTQCSKREKPNEWPNENKAHFNDDLSNFIIAELLDDEWTDASSTSYKEFY